jgi:hypothetical protein
MRLGFRQSRFSGNILRLLFMPFLDFRLPFESLNIVTDLVEYRNHRRISS